MNLIYTYVYIFYDFSFIEIKFSGQNSSIEEQKPKVEMDPTLDQQVGPQLYAPDACPYQEPAAGNLWDKGFSIIPRFPFKSSQHIPTNSTSICSMPSTSRNRVSLASTSLEEKSVSCQSREEPQIIFSVPDSLSVFRLVGNCEKRSSSGSGSKFKIQKLVAEDINK